MLVNLTSAMAYIVDYKLENVGYIKFFLVRNVPDSSIKNTSLSN